MNELVNGVHASTYKEVLSGGWSDGTSTCPDVVLTKDKKELLIFVSSTFTDTHLERDILMEKILPQLQTDARKYDISVTISDMRYGVRDENTKDHKGWLYCKHELERCYRQSSGLFFLSLQGDKYGSRILPRSIDQAIAEKKLSEWFSLLSSNSEQTEDLNHISECIKLFQAWYQLDTNAIPPEYVLRELRTVDDNLFWNHAVPTLREALSGLPCDRDCPDICIGQSITEWETRYALYLQRQKSSADNRLLWVHRQFESGISSQEDTSGILIDRNMDENLSCLLSGLLTLLKVNFGSLDTEISSNSIEPTNKRSLLVHCPSSSEYLDVIQRRQLHKMSSVQSIDSSLLRQVSASSAEELALSRSYSSNSYFCGSLAGTIISRQVSHATTTNSTCQEQNEPLQTYLRSWEVVTYQALHSEIIKISQQSNVQLKSSILQEMLHHCQWAYEKVRTFVGREQLVDEILQKINAEYDINNNSGQKKGGKSPAKLPRKPIQLALIGASGCGKTALMARIAQHLYLSEKRRASNSNISSRLVIVRFCGTSSASTNALTLLQSLIHQIMWLYNVDLRILPHASQLSHSPNESLMPYLFHNDDVYQKHVQIFHQLLQSYPIILLLDSLDQLSNDFEARSRLSFLQGLTHVHPRTRIIVSTLPDDALSLGVDSKTVSHYYYQCETRLREWEIPCISIFPFGRNGTEANNSNESEFSIILKHILANQYNRTVTPSQWSYILHQASQEPTALYLQLASRLIATWASFPSITSSSLFTELSGGVRHIIHQLFDTLEYTYGKCFTSIALGFITISRSGICDTDMCDLISLHETAMKEIYQYALNSDGLSSETRVYRAPYHVWTRLRLALEGLLVTKADGGLRWYHRQLQEVAESRYTCVDSFDSYANIALPKLIFVRQIHTCLAKYFANIVRVDIRESRLIAAQPLFIKKWNISDSLHNDFAIDIIWKLCQDSSIFHTCTLNIRKLKEVTFHVSRAITWQLRTLLTRNDEVLRNDQVSEWFTPFEIVSAILCMTSLEYIAVLAIADQQGSLLVQLLDDFNVLINSMETFYRSFRNTDHDDHNNADAAFVEWSERIKLTLFGKSMEEILSNCEYMDVAFPAHQAVRAIDPCSLFIRLQDYSSWLSANMSLILSDPAKQIMYTASRYTAHQSSTVYRDVLRLQAFQTWQQSLANDTSIPVTRRTSSAESYGIPSEDQINKYSLGTVSASNSDKYNRSGISLPLNSDSFPPSMAVPPPMSPYGNTTTPFSFTPLSGLPMRRTASKQGGCSVFSSGKSKRGGRSNKQAKATSLDNDGLFSQVALQYYQLLSKLFELDAPCTGGVVDNTTADFPIVLSPFSSRSLSRPPTLVGHKNAIRHVTNVSSPVNGGLLLSHCWSEIRLWDVRSGLCSTTWQPIVSSTSTDTHLNNKKTKAEITCVVVTPDASFVLVFVTHTLSSSSSYTEVQIWEVVAGRCIGRKRLNIPPGSTAISASANVSVHQQPDHCHIVCATINNTGSVLATAASDRSICVWQLPSVASEIPITSTWELLKAFPVAHRQDISFLSFATRVQGVETLASTSSDKTMKLWLLYVPWTDQHVTQSAGRLVLGRCISTLIGHKLPVSCLSFQEFIPSSEAPMDPSIDSHSIDNDMDSNVLNDGDMIENIEDDDVNEDFNPKEALEAFATNRSSSTVQEPLLASAAGNVIKIWAFHSTVASLSNGPKSLFFLRKQVIVSCLATLTGHQGNNIAALQFCTLSNENKNARKRLLFSCGREDRTIKIWQMAQFPFTCLQQWSAHKSYIADMCFYKDHLHHRQQLVTGSLDKNIKIWDLRRIMTLDDADASHTKVMDTSESASLPALLPSAQRETSNNGNNAAKLPNTPKSMLSNAPGTNVSYGVINEDEHRATVTCMTISPDGCFVLSASIDQQICLWDAQTHKLVRVFDHPHSEAEFSNVPNSNNNATNDSFAPVISMVRFVYSSKLSSDDDRFTSQCSLEDTYFVSAIWQNNGSFKVWHACQSVRCLRMVQAYAVSLTSPLYWDVQQSIRDIVVDYNASVEESNTLYTVSFGGRVKRWCVDQLLFPATNTNTINNNVEAMQNMKEDVFCGMVMNASTMTNNNMATNASNNSNSGKGRKAGKKGKSNTSGGLLNTNNIASMDSTIAGKGSEEDVHGCLGDYLLEADSTLTTTPFVNTVTLLQSTCALNIKSMDKEAFYSEYYASPPATPPVPSMKKTLSPALSPAQTQVHSATEHDAILVISLSNGIILILEASSGCILQRLTTQCNANHTKHDTFPPTASATGNEIPLQQHHYQRVHSSDTKSKNIKASHHASSASTSSMACNAAIEVPFVTPGGNFKNMMHMTSGTIGSQHLISVHILNTGTNSNNYLDSNNSKKYTVIAAGLMHASDNEASETAASVGCMSDVPMDSVLWVWNEVSFSPMFSTCTDNITMDKHGANVNALSASCKSKRQQRLLSKQSEKKTTVSSIFLHPQRVFHWQQYVQYWRQLNSVTQTKPMPSLSLAMEKKDILRQSFVNGDQSLIVMTGGGEIYALNLQTLLRGDCVSSHGKVIKESIVLYDDWLSCVCSQQNHSSLKQLPLLIGTRNGAILTAPLK